MSLTQETVLLQVDIQANNARLVELQKQLNDNKAATDALNKSFKDGAISAEDYAAGQVRLKQSAADTAQEMRALNKANADQKKSTDAAKGSINQLRAELAQGTAAYNALSEAERDNTAAGQRLQAQNKALSDRLKELEGRIGDTRRNVGNYSGSLRDAIKESGLFGGVTQKITEAQEGFTAAQNIAKAAIGGNITALGALRLALIATGLGAIVVVLGSVIAFLTKTSAGTDLVSRKFAGLKAIVSLVTGTAAEFGETLFKAVENPKQAISDLVDFIETNLLNRLKAVSIILQAIADRDSKKLTDGLYQMGLGVTNATDKFNAFVTAAGKAADAGERIEAENQRILRAERALNVERDESRAKIEGLKKLSDDTTKSTAVRARAAQEAGRIENGLLAEQLKLQDDKIKNLLASQKLQKTISNDDLDALAELRRERANTQQESLTLQTELQNKINGLAEEGRKALDDAALAALDTELATYKEREAAAARFRDSEDNARLQAKEKREKDAADVKAAEAQRYARDLKMLEENLAQRRVLLETALAEGAVSKEQYEASLTLIEQGGLSARLMLAKVHNQDTAALEREATQFHNEQLNERTDKEQAEYEKQLAVAVQFGQEIGALFAQTLTESGKSLQEFAANALILLLDVLQKQTLAQVAAATTQSLASGDSVATYGIAGLAKAAIINGLIVAAFQGAKALISQGVTKKFEQGGVLQGPSHAAGGIPFTVAGRPGFEAEGGEAIMSKGAVQQFAPLLSWLNVLGGGRQFAAGGIIPAAPRSVDGGLAARSIGVSVAIDYTQLAYTLDSVLRQQPFETSVRSFNQAQARYNTPRRTSRLGD